MKTFLRCVTFLSIGLTGGVGAIPNPKEPLSLTVSLPEATVRKGSQIIVKTVLTNISKNVLTIYDTNGYCQYPVEVRDAGGHQVPDTEFKRQLRCDNKFVIGRYIIITLKPNESKEDEVNVSELSDMTRPGKYVVQIMRTIPKDMGKAPIKSNIITVTVTN